MHGTPVQALIKGPLYRLLSFFLKNDVWKVQFLKRIPRSFEGYKIFDSLCQFLPGIKLSLCRHLYK